MIDYRQHLRESTLKATADKSPEVKADMLNMIEAIIAGDLTPDEIVERIGDGTLPKAYKVKGKQ